MRERNTADIGPSGGEAERPSRSGRLRGTLFVFYVLLVIALARLGAYLLISHRRLETPGAEAVARLEFITLFVLATVVFHVLIARRAGQSTRLALWMLVPIVSTIVMVRTLWRASKAPPAVDVLERPDDLDSSSAEFPDLVADDENLRLCVRAGCADKGVEVRVRRCHQCGAATQLAV